MYITLHISLKIHPQPIPPLPRQLLPQAAGLCALPRLRLAQRRPQLVALLDRRAQLPLRVAEGGLAGGWVCRVWGNGVGRIIMPKKEVE